MNHTEQDVLRIISQQAELLSNFAWLEMITENQQQKADSRETMLAIAEELQRVITEELPEVQP